MKLLLDTHALLWLLLEPDRLSKTSAAAIEDSSNQLSVSVAALWEIAIKRRTGRLSVPDDLPDRLTPVGVTILPITAEQAWRAGALPLIYRDPFDRMMVAQALTETMTLVTRDRMLASYGVEVLAA